jgi:hypothetical protein
MFYGLSRYIGAHVILTMISDSSGKPHPVVSALWYAASPPDCIRKTLPEQSGMRELCGRCFPDMLIGAR